MFLFISTLIISVLHFFSPMLVTLIRTFYSLLRPFVTFCPVIVTIKKRFVTLFPVLFSLFRTFLTLFQNLLSIRKKTLSLKNICYRKKTAQQTNKNAEQTIKVV